MAKSITDFFGKVIKDHVKDGLGRPMQNGSADGSYQNIAASELWSQIKLANAMENQWVNFCNSMKNSDGNSIIPPTTVTYTYGGNKITNPGIEYEIEWGLKVIKSGIAIPFYWIKYKSNIDLSSASKDDIWICDRGHEYLVEQVNNFENKILIAGPISKIDGTSGGGHIKSGDQGKISKSFHGGTPSGETQEFDATGSSGTFKLGEMITGSPSGATGKVLDSDGLTKGYFKSNPQHIPYSIGPPIVLEHWKVELTDVSHLSVGVPVIFEDYNGQTLETILFNIGGDTVKTYDNISGFSRNTPSWVKLKNPTDIATFLNIELQGTTKFLVGDIVTGDESGTTTILQTDNTDYSENKSNPEHIQALLNILKAVSPQCICIIGPSSVPLPLIVT